VASGARSALPETVVGMVQARLDTLGSDAKRVLRAASIFGQSFRREGGSALISDRDRAAIATSLGVLVEREVILAEGRRRRPVRLSATRCCATRPTPC